MSRKVPERRTNMCRDEEMQQCESRSGTEMEQKLQLCVFMTLLEGEYILDVTITARQVWSFQTTSVKCLNLRKFVQNDQNCPKSRRHLLVTFVWICLCAFLNNEILPFVSSELKIKTKKSNQDIRKPFKVTHRNTTFSKGDDDVYVFSELQWTVSEPLFLLPTV